MTRYDIDAIETIDEYISKNDWRVNANANQRYSLGGMILNTSGKVMANYWLEKHYSEAANEAHRSGDIHIHDLDMLSGYCAGWSLRALLEEGFNGADGAISSAPPKHLSSAVGQIVNFFGTLQNEWAGAQAFSSFDTYMAPFVRVDNLSYDEVKQNLQEMIFNLNVPSRWGGQAPFTNLTFDWVCPEDISDNHPLIGGEEVDFTYGDLQEEMDMINRAFIEVMSEGDADGRAFTFPIPTYNITKDFDWESANSRALFDMTAKYGLPYFQNFINSDLDPGMIRSMCPLTADTEVLVRSKENGVRKADISTIVRGMERKGIKYEVWTPNGWKGAEPVRATPSDSYTLKLSNGMNVSMGENHLQPVRNKGTVKAVDIEVGDWIPFSKEMMKTGQLGTEEIGFLVGAYLGDGSSHDGIITYSLNQGSKKETLEKLRRIWESIGYKTSETDGGDGLIILGGAESFVSRFVKGSKATDKDMKDLVFDMSIPFREGVIQGYTDTDGAKDRNRLYTSSKKLANSLISLLVSVGRKGRLGAVDERDGRLGDNPVYRVDAPERDSYGEIFKSDDEYNYYRVEEIVSDGYEENLYCFEVDDPSHLFTLANGMVTHNCRLQLDLTELLKRGNGLFGSAELTGSIGVVTINLARLGYKFKGDKEGLIKELDRLINISAGTLEEKRVVVQDLMDGGLFPFTRRYLGTLNNHFSTIGVNGMNELVRNYTDDENDITDEFGHELSVEILDHIRDRMVELQENTGHMYNLEATPAEGTTYRFAKEDKALYPDILQAGTEEQPYYTNSSQLPVGYTDDPFLALAEQDELQKKYTGGTVLHLYMGERMSSGHAAAQLVKKALTNFELPYLTITPTFSVCPTHGYLNGEQVYCPKCASIGKEQECEIWERVMGYLRPLSSFNIGKKGEHAERLSFKEPEISPITVSPKTPVTTE